MRIFIILGIILFVIGILLSIITSRWQGYYYESTYSPLSLIGLLLIIIGLGLVLITAYLNGQLN